jgi:hypothetical protein
MITFFFLKPIETHLTPTRKDIIHPTEKTDSRQRGLKLDVTSLIHLLMFYQQKIVLVTSFLLGSSYLANYGG